MRALLQRVAHAKVTVDNQITGKIDAGLLIFLGITHCDTTKEADYLAEKAIKLRIFRDDNDKMNRSLLDMGGSVLVVSQFTLYADSKHGLRPGYSEAAEPEKANELYEYFIKKIQSLGVNCQTGVFGGDMKVELENSGPVTIMLEK